MKLMKKRNLYTNQLQIKKSLRTKIYEFLKEEIKKEGIKKKSDEELSNIFNLELKEQINEMKNFAKFTKFAKCVNFAAFAEFRKM